VVGFGAGCGLLLVVNVGVLILLIALQSQLTNQAWWGFLIGLVQLVYVVPIVLRLRTAGQTSLVQGLIVGAAITFLLSAACFGIVGPSVLTG
jgi:hypothetical protein